MGKCIESRLRTTGEGDSERPTGSRQDSIYRPIEMRSVLDDRMGGDNFTVVKGRGVAHFIHGHHAT
jgi:hypothetical protein